MISDALVAIYTQPVDHVNAACYQETVVKVINFEMWLIRKDSQERRVVWFFIRCVRSYMALEDKDFI